MYVYHSAKAQIYWTVLYVNQTALHTALFTCLLIEKLPSFVSMTLNSQTINAEQMEDAYNMFLQKPSTVKLRDPASHQDTR